MTRETLTQGEVGDNFLVRDRRNGGWYWIPNDLLRRAGHQIGPAGVAVYNALAMYASEPDQTCYPSRTSIARLLGMSRSAVYHALEKLRRFRIIEVLPPEDPARTHAPNVYVLTSPELWEIPDENGHGQLPASQKSSSQGGDHGVNGELAGQPGGLAEMAENGVSKTRLASEVLTPARAGHPDGNDKNPSSGVKPDAGKMQNRTGGPELAGVEKAQGNGETRGSDFGDRAINKTNKNKTQENKTQERETGASAKGADSLSQDFQKFQKHQDLEATEEELELAKDVLEAFNLLAGEKDFRPNATNLRPIVELIREGYGREHFEAVIYHVTGLWANTPLETNLRPRVVFEAERFREFLDEVEGLVPILKRHLELSDQLRALRERLRELAKLGQQRRSEGAPEEELESLRRQYQHLQQQRELLEERIAEVEAEEERWLAKHYPSYYGESNPDRAEVAT